ncbi:MAG: FliM/FliN family flagellar motor switch protein [Bdellovibrionales bacterium]|nr:FliM/FliN family flagellar motor switch protein [Bdellovibrionales bacterium]
MSTRAAMAESALDSSSGEREQESAAGVRPVALVAGERIVRGRLPAVELLHERLARCLRQQLMRTVERPCEVDAEPIQTPRFSEWIESADPLTLVQVFRVRGSSEHIAFAASQHTVAGVVDLLMGGTGHSHASKQKREFTSLEIRLMGRIFEAVRQALAPAWASGKAPNLDNESVEQNLRLLSFVSPSERICILSYRSVMGSAAMQLSAIFPLQWLTRSLNADSALSTVRADPRADDWSIRMGEAIRECKVTLQAELAHGSISLADVLQLSVGSVLQLQTAPDAPAVVKVEGSAIYEARVGTARGHRAIVLGRPLGAKDRR